MLLITMKNANQPNWTRIKNYYNGFDFAVSVLVSPVKKRFVVTVWDGVLGTQKVVKRFAPTERQEAIQYAKEFFKQQYKIL